MSGISTGGGFFSGIDTNSLIQQLIAAESRPRRSFQARVAQLQLQNTAYLDINTRVGALRSAAQGFRTANTFQLKAAASSDSNVLAARATIQATPGSTTMLVDRLVSTQQMRSRGFTDSASTGLGMTSIRVEGAQARLDRDVDLADLNNGEGVSRGKISVTDSSGARAEIDLSRATTMSEVLDAINGDGRVRVTASVSGGRIVLQDGAGGGGTMSVGNVGDTGTATSLGIAGTATAGRLTGSTVYRLNANTALSALNDGNGVAVRTNTTESDFSFGFTVDSNDGSAPRVVRVNLGDVFVRDPAPPGSTEPGPLRKTESAVTTLGQAVGRINAAISAAGVTNLTASINSETGTLVMTDAVDEPRTVTFTESGTGTAARDLGLTGSFTGGTYAGRRLLAGLSTTLASGLNGGRGIGGDGVVNITARDGSSVVVNLGDAAARSRMSVQDVLAAFEQQSGGKIRAALDSRGTGIVLTDTTGATTSNLIVRGTSGSDTAAALGIATAAEGVASATVSSGNLQRQYVTRATALSSLSGGRGIGLGVFRITDTSGATASVDIGNDSRTIGDIIDEINSRPLNVEARINANGDGIEIVPKSGEPAGGVRIKVEDERGAVARGLNLAGTATGSGADNKIDGSFERTIALAATDTLNDVMGKINRANAGVRASVVRDGSGATPFRLSMAASASGSAGRVIVDSGSFDLGLTTLEQGRDARVFYGASDPAKALAATSSTNTIEGVISGVSIDLKAASNNPVTVTVTADTGAMVTAVEAFIRVFNTAVDRIDSNTRFNTDTRQGGPLLNDATAQELRAALFRTVQGRGQNVTGRFDRLADVGIRVGSGGDLVLDRGKFEAALAEDPESVERLFTAREVETSPSRELEPGISVRNPTPTESFSTLSVMGQLENLANRYVSVVDGVLTGRTRSVTDQISAQNRRISDFDARIARRRETLEAQFLRMERAIGQLQTQQSALATIPRR